MLFPFLSGKIKSKIIYTMDKIKDVLEKQIELIKPSKEIADRINKVSKKFIDKLRKKLKTKKINAEIFIGGSIAKNTLIKKDKYDIDIFVRFDKKYNKISKLLGKIIGNKAKKVHGSRDYYQLIKEGIIIETIPVLKIKKPEEAKNVTDLSYFHVKYIVNKIKANRKLAEQIILAKAFCHAQDCYGAESYINGFSGYALELLICHYGSFLNFIREIAEAKGRIIIDDSKFYKNKENVLTEVNESKIQNPIILIDPTFKERNALASLSQDTFFKFKKACEAFLRNPSSEFFIRKNIFEELKRKYGKKIIVVSIKTNKQKGDIAGTKSKKFFGFFMREINREFKIRASEFDYDDRKNIAYFYLIFDKKPDETVRGPPITNLKGLTAFKKIHPNAFIKEHFAYAHLKHNLSFEEFFKRFLEKDKKIIREMSIKEIKLVR